MVIRSQLAVLNFNSANGLEQARTKSGEKKYKVGFSIIIKEWLSKPVKAKKDNFSLKEMVEGTTECAGSKTTLPIPVIPNLLKNITNV